MKSLEATACARSGLLGNPSDGYNGKTVSFIVRNFETTVRLSSANRIILIPGSHEQEFESMDAFEDQIRSHGYYGGIRLIKSTIFEFASFCRERGITLDRPFEISFTSNIPQQVGLAGSSAIVIAAFRALCSWFQVSIEPHILATLALSAENAIGISGGLQDRVIQSFEGLVYMDFGTDVMQTEDGVEFGQYEKLPPDLVGNLYIAYATDTAQSTEVLHNDLKSKYESGDSRVIDTLNEIAALAAMGKLAIETGDQRTLAELINLNFDLRRKICEIHPEHLNMVQTARNCGASAKFCGSGGAIVGTYNDEAMWNTLADAMATSGYSIIRPQIVAS